MATYAEQAALQALINQALAQPGGPTQAQAELAAQMAQSGGFTPADLAALSGGAYTEGEIVSSVNDLTDMGRTDYDYSGYSPGQRAELVNENFTTDISNLPGANSAGFGRSDGSGGDTQTIRTETAIPAYLQPFLNESSNFQLGSLYALGDALTRPDAMVSPFNVNQLKSLNMAADVGNGGGGYVDQAQSVFKEVADGSDIEALASRGQNLLENSAGRNSLSSFSANSAINPTATSSLEQIASGSNLYGSDGFNAALQASMDAAQPMIASTFSNAGSGGLKSGLAQTAMQKAASDSFAQLYGQNQNNQLQAANTLGGLSLSGRGLQQDAASRLMGADQQAGSIYSQLANADRSRQISAAQMLPQMGLINSQILGSVGDQQQAQDERQKLGGINQYQQLMNAAFGGINQTSLLGHQQTTQMPDGNQAAGILGGALSGAKLGSMIPGLGTGIGAIGGGLLGAFG